MHLLIISSASSTLKVMRSVSGTGTLPLQRDLLGIFVQRQVDRYMTGREVMETWQEKWYRGSTGFRLLDV